MNIIYNALLRSERQYSATELKYYSYLISTINLAYNLGFDKETGELKQEDLIEFLNRNCSGCEEEDCYTINLNKYASNRKIAKEINTSETNIRKIKNNFIEYGIMTDSDLIFKKDVITSGYFHLTETPELYKFPSLHITYSFLASMSKRTGGVCALMRYKLAQLLNTDESNVKTQLHRLSKMGLVKRNNNGFLTIENSNKTKGVKSKNKEGNLYNLNVCYTDKI